MTKKRPKTTDALMRYLREEKGISISGSSQKRKLMNISFFLAFLQWIWYTINVNCGKILRSLPKEIGCVRFPFLFFMENHNK